MTKTWERNVDRLTMYLVIYVNYNLRAKKPRNWWLGYYNSILLIVVDKHLQEEEMKETKRSPVVEKKKTPPIAVSKSFKSKGSTVRNSSRVAGNFIIMTELRNKILTLRDLLDLSPCIGSASVNEVHFCYLSLEQKTNHINP